MGMIMLNGIAYTSSDGARDFPPLIYSTEEQEVGVWIDGKPLYEKTIEFPYDSTWTGHRTFVNHGISNIDKPVHLYGRIYNNAYSQLTNFQIRSANDNYSSNVSIWSENMQEISGFNQTNFTLILGNALTSQYIHSIVITFQYTKTTDTPGSGKWSAFGGGSNVIHEEYFEWKRGTSTTTAESMRYTAPCDGWVTVLQYMDKNNDAYCCVEAAIYNPNTNVTKQVDIDDGRQRYHTWHLGFPAKRGDVIIIKTRLDSGTLPTSATFRFIG